MEIHFAPLQGYTDFEYRRIHARHCGGVDTYYTPFIRWEKSGIRDKDIKDIFPENNEGLHLIPQIICADTDEFNRLADTIQEHGYEEMDLNMGCPAPMQTKLMRGSGILPYPTRVSALLKEMERRPEVRFSAKMRLGLEEKEEWRELSDMLNSSCLKHLTVHPRIGKQMYKGEVDMDAFSEVYSSIHIPIIYNGDVTSMEQVSSLSERYPGLHGIMMGRGLLALPTMAKECLMGEEMPHEERMSILMQMHEDMLGYCTRKYKVDSQILLHIHAFWEYQESQLERKTWKKIMKAGNMKNYLEAIRKL
ncbi:MAG: tRNA-dihydrouridine synthase family protein [Bacteroidaceae bacterium]|nr:tRNA-dihydrouridine synthase family protein [Bacteroidaceae bacterium]